MRHLGTKIILLTFWPYFVHIQGVKLKPRSARFYHKPYDLIHILNQHRKHNNFNYNYDDWEDNYDVIDYEQTAQTTSTEKVVKTAKVTTENSTDIKTDTRSKNNATLDTTVNEIHEEITTTFVEKGTSTLSTPGPDTTIDETTTEHQKIEVTSVVANVTGTTTKTSETISDTTTSTTPTTIKTNEDATIKLPETTENLLELYTSVTITESDVPTFILETYFPGTTFDILNFTKPLPITTKNPFIEELIGESQKHGYFTYSMIILFKTLLKKNHKEITTLLAALNSKVERLNREDKLMLFGGMVAEVFQSMVQMLVLEPADVMHGHLNYAVYALEHRHTLLREDTNTLIDVTDSIYIEADLDNVAKVIKEISEYPDNKESAKNIISTAIEAYVYVPFRRIIGTAKERLFIMELNSNIRKRLYPESVP